MMQLFMWMLCSITLLFSDGVSSHDFSEKLIVSASKSEVTANNELLKLKVYFIENPTTRLLQEKYDLQIEMEKLDNYYVAVIKPINSLSLRNELLISLTPMFQNIFFIDYKERIFKSNQKMSVPKYSTPLAKKKKEVSYINEIGLQWLVLLLLSVVGLILSVRNRRKIKKLSKRQKNLTVEQNKIEKEIKKLGAEDA